MTCMRIGSSGEEEVVSWIGWHDPVTGVGCATDASGKAGISSGIIDVVIKVTSLYSVGPCGVATCLVEVGYK